MNQTLWDNLCKAVKYTDEQRKQWQTSPTKHNADLYSKAKEYEAIQIDKLIQS